MSRRLQEELLVQKADTCSLRRQWKAFQLADPEGPNGELIERTYDHAIASHSLQGRIKNMEVVEDFESRPHKEATFLVERNKDFQVWREHKMPRSTTRIQWWKAAWT